MADNSNISGPSKSAAAFTSAPTQPSAPAQSPAPESAKSEIQLLIQETLNVPAHLTTRLNNGDMHMSYTRYLAVEDARRKLKKMQTDGTWTEKMPTLQEIAGLFMSKSVYYEVKKVFAFVPKYPEVEKWLLNAEDAPSDAALWGSKRVTFEKLRKKILKEEKGKYSIAKKGKERQTEYDSSSEEITDKKGKGKAKAKGGKRGSSSKSYDQ